MPLPSHITTILFDCDGVLVDSEALGLEDSAAFLHSYGFEWGPKELVQKFTGYRDDVFRKILEDAYFDIHQAAAPEDLFFGLVETRRRKKNELKIIPKANLAIETTRTKGFDLAVASSSRTEFLERKLKHTNLWHLLTPHIYSAELVAHGKPAPDIFIYAAEKLNRNAQECLVIEDSVQGVKAGLAAGMVVWGFIGGGHCFDGHGESLLAAGAAKIVDNFQDFIALL